LPPGTSNDEIATTLYADDAATAAQGVPVSAIVVDEAPTGLVNGVNLVYTLSSTPEVGTVQFFIDGQLQTEGGSNDYTISGATVTVIGQAPETGQIVLASYIKSGTAAGAHGINDHADVSTSGVATDDYLEYDGASFVPQAPSYTTVNMIGQAHGIVPAATASAPHLIPVVGPVTPLGTADDLVAPIAFTDVSGFMGLTGKTTELCLEATVSYNATAIGTDLLVELLPITGTAGGPGAITYTFGAPVLSIPFAGPDILPSQSVVLGAFAPGIPSGDYAVAITPVTGPTAASSHATVTAKLYYYHS